MASVTRVACGLALGLALGCAGGSEEAAAPAGDDAAAVSGLSAEDLELVALQKVCPVSGEALDSMGEPYRVEVDGRVVFTCCEDCADMVKEDPGPYLAKIDAAQEE